MLEATSDYWRPFYYLLEARGLVVWRVNAKPAYLIAPNTRTNNHYYQSGTTALDNIIADTSQTPAVTDSMVNYKNVAKDFTAEQAEASVPECDANGTPKSLSDTFCWVFNDGKA